MDRIVYNALCSYYNALEKTGYMAHSHTEKLLVLIFIRDFVYNDYRGIISKDDYHLIERALDCLYGSTCLIPYPDYLKMGKLHLGEVTELGERLRQLENTEVFKPMFDINGMCGDLQLVNCDEYQEKPSVPPCEEWDAPAPKRQGCPQESPCAAAPLPKKKPVKKNRCQKKV